MRSLVLGVALPFAIVATTASIAACAPEPGSGDIDVRDQALVGDELRLLVESFRHYRPFLSHSSKVSDVKGWYVAIDLASTKPVAERARVYGPLWESPEPRSFVSHDVGASFTTEDAAAAAAQAACRFDADGTLLRFSFDASTNTIVRDAFVAQPKGGSWTRLGAVKPVHDRVGPMSEDRVESPSGRWRLLRQGPSVQLFDMHTGEQVDDPWLTGCFARARSIKKFENVCYSLTEQLDFLIVSPQPWWNDDSEHGVGTFELDGSTWMRSDVGIAFARPDPAPRLFRRKPASEGGDTWNSPRDAYSFDGELRLFSFDDTTLRLWQAQGVADGAPAVGPDLVKEVGALKGPLKFWQPLRPTGTNQIQLFHLGEPSPTTDFRDVVGVTTWDLAADTLVDRDARLADLFEDRGGQRLPKSLLPVK